jgi:hypothetical protein
MDVRTQILQADDLVTKEVHIPEWNATVRVKSLTGAERDEFEASITSIKGDKANTNLRGMRAKLAIACCVDADGKPLFKSSDLQALAGKSARALSRIFDVAAELNGLSKSDVEELTGNSEPDPSDVSTSA